MTAGAEARCEATCVIHGRKYRCSRLQRRFAHLRHERRWEQAGVVITIAWTSGWAIVRGVNEDGSVILPASLDRLPRIVTYS